MALTTQIKKAWNAFVSDEQSSSHAYASHNMGPMATYAPHRTRAFVYNDKTIVTSIYTRIAVDVSGIAIRHIELDEQLRFKGDMDSNLNRCFTLEPNLDQGPRQFRQDIVNTMFDSGVAAIVPIDTTVSPLINGRFDVHSLRVGKVVEWYPRHVKVNVYNEKKGVRQDILVEKHMVAIVENPLYAVMNETNSTLQRLIRKLHLLDTVDEASSSGKLDLIIQLPYTIKSEARKNQAEQRREDIEFQLKGSQYGIAYTDGTEKITQLNRPAENNLLKQVEYLTNMLYHQLGITEEVMNGTADEKTMLNYFSRTIEPILDAVVEAMERSYLGRNGIRRNERIQYFREPFKLVPLQEIAVIADKFSRNEILTANEIRSFMGLAPSKDPKADKLENSNMPKPEDPSDPDADLRPDPDDLA